MKRWFLVLMLLWPLCVLAQSTPEVPAPPPGPAAKRKSSAPVVPPQPLQTWRTKSGQVFVGSMMAHNFKTREILIENSEGARVKIPVIELDGESKLRWLQSPIFTQGLAKNYPAKDHLREIVIVYGSILAVSIVIGFFLYWLAVAIIAGNGSLFSAMKTYLLVNLATLLVFLVAGGLMVAVVRFVPESKFVPIINGGLGFAAWVASIALFCRIIAAHYKVSGCSGCAVMVIWGILGAVIQGGFYLVAPWMLRQPFIDDYFSNYILEPLGLI